MKRLAIISIIAAFAAVSCGSSTGRTKTVEEGVKVVSAPVGKAPSPKQYYARAVKEYPHDVTSYTQGLFFHDGNLYETTGLNGESTLRLVDLETGEALRKLSFDKKYFIEGSTVLGGDLFILTWENNMVFIYDPKTLEYKSTFRYRREGWGLTTDGEYLIASDGSSHIYFMDTKLVTRKILGVTMNGRALRNLNELEYIDGKIWANVYLTDIVVVIDPDTGYVESVVDCSGLYPAESRLPQADVLNGIAFRDGKIYLTGKKWPKMYEIELIEK